MSVQPNIIPFPTWEGGPEEVIPGATMSYPPHPLSGAERGNCRGQMWGLREGGEYFAGYFSAFQVA
jgi:hypothetical protein